jgi:nitronate monooxygenase
VREFLGQWGPAVPAEVGDAMPLDFAAQCEASLVAGPRMVSSIMGLFSEKFVAEFRARGIAWLASATTLAEARAAVSAGADAIVAQGSSATPDIIHPTNTPCACTANRRSARRAYAEGRAGDP